MAVTVKRNEDPFNAATLNRAMDGLAALYQATGNAFEPIVSGSVSSTVPLINLDLGGVSWRYLRLRAALTGAGTAYLLVNSIGGAGLYLGRVFVISLSYGISPSYQLMFLNSSYSFVDAMIMPTVNGIQWLGRNSVYDSGECLTYMGNGSFTSLTTPLASLQIQGPTAGPITITAGSYVLEGIRA